MFLKNIFEFFIFSTSVELQSDNDVCVYVSKKIIFQKRTQVLSVLIGMILMARSLEKKRKKSLCTLVHPKKRKGLLKKTRLLTLFLLRISMKQ